LRFIKGGDGHGGWLVLAYLRLEGCMHRFARYPIHACGASFAPQSSVDAFEASFAPQSSVDAYEASFAPQSSVDAYEASFAPQSS
jgi:hypothetical protein